MWNWEGRARIAGEPLDDSDAISDGDVGVEGCWVLKYVTSAQGRRTHQCYERQVDWGHSTELPKARAKSVDG